MASEINLTLGQIALVSDDDFEELSKYNWFANKQNGTKYYATRKVRYEGKQQMIRMHRAVWELHHGTIFRGLEIDHINHNTLDNTIDNLRICTHAQNHFNQIRNRNDYSSKYKGVWLQNNRWLSRIKYNGEKIYLGSFDNEIDAAIAYNNKAKELFGEFANLNIFDKFDHASSMGVCD